MMPDHAEDPAKMGKQKILNVRSYQLDRFAYRNLRRRLQKTICLIKADYQTREGAEGEIMNY